MNTVTPNVAIFQRFLWKEIRMLRGFWLAVGVLGVLMQLVLKSAGVSSSMLFVAWGAAALYAVGAAVTLFSAETEERTRDFLLNLPGHWLPMFAAKVTTATVSAFGLGIFLCATGAGMGGASMAEFQNASAVGGVAVFEAIAWGLLFSLGMKQPLLAAVLAMGAASLGAQQAITATPSAAQHSFSIDAYREAIPNRLLLTLAVFAVDLWLGARWLKTSPRRTKASQGDTATGVATPSRGMMARLLWQTWRESWKTMLVAIPIAILLMVALAMPLSLFQNSAYYVDLPLPLLPMLFLPALLGSLVFRADQRGDHRQFLVAHAARPRAVWLARHAVWGAGLFAILFAISLGIWIVVGFGIGDSLQQILRNKYSGSLFGGEHFDRALNEPWRLDSYLGLLVSQALQWTFYSWTSTFAAYALGQFCSLIFRREVLAGLLALLLSIVLAAWILVANSWQLSSWWFVLPIGVGAMLATWLRMPDWIVGRNRLRAWALPITAVLVPLVLVVAMLPSARLAQLHEEPGHQEFMEQVRAYDSDKSAGQATALAYERLYASMSAKDEADEKSEISEEEIAELIKITQRPECRFPAATGPHINFLREEQLEYLRNVLLSDADRLQSLGEIDAALERYLAVIRMDRHELSLQPSAMVERIAQNGHLYAGRRKPRVNKLVIAWAQHSDQTSELLRKAVTELQNSPPTSLEEVILADREQIRAVLLEDVPPRFLNEKQPRWSGYLAYLANRLPWERQRALQSLDIRTLQLLDCVRFGRGGNEYKIFQLLHKQRHRNQVPMPHQSAYKRDWDAYNRATQSARQASTSYLMAQELNSHMNIYNSLLQTLEIRGMRSRTLAHLAHRLDQKAIGR